MICTFLNSFGANGSGSGPTYTPPTITTASYKQWCEARHLSGLSDGDAVSTFTDQSGLGNDWSQSTSGKKPLYKTNIVNGQPILRFDGSDDHFTLASDILSGASEGEVFLVIKIDTDPPASQDQSGLWKMDGEPINGVNYPWTNSEIYEAWGATARKSTGVNPSPSLTSWRLYNVASAASDYKIRLDGTQIYSTGTNTFSSFGATRYLGRSASLFGDIYVDGDIAGIVIVDAVLDSTDRDTIENELATAYGLTIA